MLFKSSVMIMLTGLVAAAPTKNATTSASSATVIVQNNCAATLKVGQSVWTEYNGDTLDVAAGSSHTYTFPMGWIGRIWGRENCGGDNCFNSGMGSPASLAEFNFGANGNVFYDISLVDGFNLPMAISPSEHAPAQIGDDSRFCNKLSCSTLPSCPKGFETHDDQGKLSGCMSACTKYNTDEYCCTGDHGSADTCTTNTYASAVKDVCPDAYSYPFDDATSAFKCSTYKFTVSFC